jgi:hypothetical protein
MVKEKLKQSWEEEKRQFHIVKEAWEERSKKNTCSYNNWLIYPSSHILSKKKFYWWCSKRRWMDKLG